MASNSVTLGLGPAPERSPPPRLDPHPHTASWLLRACAESLRPFQETWCSRGWFFVCGPPRIQTSLCSPKRDSQTANKLAFNTSLKSLVKLTGDSQIAGRIGRCVHMGTRARIHTHLVTFKSQPPSGTLECDLLWRDGYGRRSDSLTRGDAGGKWGP